MIKHRNERRGIGGVFFDDMNDRDQDELLAFATDMVWEVQDSSTPRPRFLKAARLGFKTSTLMKRKLPFNLNLIFELAPTLHLGKARALW